VSWSSLVPLTSYYPGSLWFVSTVVLCGPCGPVSVLYYWLALSCPVGPAWPVSGLDDLPFAGPFWVQEWKGPGSN